MTSRIHNNFPKGDSSRAKARLNGALFMTLLGLTGCTQICSKPLDINQLTPPEEFSQYSDGTFFNEEETRLAKPGGYVGMLKAYVMGKETRFPETEPPSHPHASAEAIKRQASGLHATWVGHATVLLQVDGHTILTDPMFSRRTFPLVGPKRFLARPPITIDQLPDIDVVLISHNHYDHLDKASIRQLIPRVGHFIVPLKVGKKLAAWGVSPSSISELAWWDEISPVPGLTLTATPARHFSGRGLRDGNKTLWASWAISGPDHSVFFSGDSGYTSAFKAIGEKLGPFDLTLMECGAYSPFWPDIHMQPEESVQAHRDVQGGVMVPIHSGTFNLAIHDWFEPMERALKAAGKKGVTLATPMAGDTVTIGKALPQTAWWRPKQAPGLASSTALATETD